MDLEDIHILLEDLLALKVWDPLLFWVKLLAAVYCAFCCFAIVVIFTKRNLLAKAKSEVQEVVHDMQYDQRPKTVFEKRWISIKDLLKSDNYSDYRAAIIDADNLLDEALSASGIKGGNLGDRLKRIDKGKLANLEELWQARKLRNSFVHQPDYQPKRMEIEAAINEYETSLKDLGFLNFDEY